MLFFLITPQRIKKRGSRNLQFTGLTLLKRLEGRGNRSFNLINSTQKTGRTMKVLLAVIGISLSADKGQQSPWSF